MVEYTHILMLLDQIISDRTVPKNIRAAAESSKSTILSKEAEELKISTAIHTLDEVSNDPNIPVYTRTHIWNLVSMLEQARRDLK